MKLERINPWLTLLANIGVIAGIVFLAAELRQNNEQLAAQSRAERLAVRTDWINALYRDADLADLIVRARNGDELTEAEEFRIQHLGSRMFAALEYVFGEVQRGMIDNRAISAADWRGAFRELPRAKEAWNRSRSGLDPEFVQWVEENVINEL